MCEGLCRRSFHVSCLNLKEFPPEGERYFCPDCQKGVHTCTICQKSGKDNVDVIKCRRLTCGRFYHPQCCTKDDLFRFRDQNGKPTNKPSNSFLCPNHTCRYCGEKGGQTLDTVLLVCLICPSAYHYECAVANNAHILSDHYMVCGNGKHYDVSHLARSNEFNLEVIEELKRTEAKRLKNESKLKTRGDLESDSECYNAESTDAIIYHRRPGSSNGNNNYKKAYNGSTSKRRRNASSNSLELENLDVAEFSAMEEPGAKLVTNLDEDLALMTEDQEALSGRRARKRKKFN